MFPQSAIGSLIVTGLFVSTLSVGLIGSTSQKALTASAIAEARNGVVYYCEGELNANIARDCVMRYCLEASGKQCELLGRTDSSGYSAVAKSQSRIGWALGYSSQQAANRAALAHCARYTPSNETCRIVLTYADTPSARPLCLNPATGLQIISGPCGPGGIDLQGNPWGVKLR